MMIVLAPFKKRICFLRLLFEHLKHSNDEIFGSTTSFQPHYT
jgi:hypothetical protein